MCNGTTFSDEECVFDEKYYSEKNYATNALIKSFVWNDKNKQAQVLMQDGNLITVQYWACRHLGVQAVMLLNSIDMGDESVVREKIRSMAKLLVRPGDYKEAITILDKTNCLRKKECKKIIPIKGYSEFYMQTERQQESMTVLLKYYLN